MPFTTETLAHSLKTFTLPLSGGAGEGNFFSHEERRAFFNSAIKENTPIKDVKDAQQSLKDFKDRTDTGQEVADLHDNPAEDPDIKITQEDIKAYQEQLTTVQGKLDTVFVNTDPVLTQGLKTDFEGLKDTLHNVETVNTFLTNIGTLIDDRLTALDKHIKATPEANTQASTPADGGDKTAAKLATLSVSDLLTDDGEFNRTEFDKYFGDQGTEAKLIQSDSQDAYKKLHKDFIAKSGDMSTDSPESFEVFKKIVLILQIPQDQRTEQYPWITAIDTNNGGISTQELPELQKQVELIVANDKQHTAEKRIKQEVKKVLEKSWIAQMLGPEVTEQLLTSSGFMGVLARIVLGADSKAFQNMANGDTHFVENFLSDHQEQYDKDFTDSAKALSEAQKISTYSQLKEEFKQILKNSENNPEVAPTSTLLRDLTARFGEKSFSKDKPIEEFQAAGEKSDGKLTLRTKLPSDALAIKHFYDAQLPPSGIMDLIGGEGLDKLKGDLLSAPKTEEAKKDKVGNIQKKLAQATEYDPWGENRKDIKNFPGSVQARAEGNRVILQWSNKSLAQIIDEKVQAKMPKKQEKEDNA